MIKSNKVNEINKLNRINKVDRIDKINEISNTKNVGLVALFSSIYIEGARRSCMLRKNMRTNKTCILTLY